ncbi:hypothetical protein ACFY9N_09720 [Microbacterium sp. NPDC008134]|uniref:hypothetical protein n=1 Tax=Microbacterium sp. NPDC008134 TaxID=3364183 RepID=UPI0036E5D9FC
MNHSDHHPDGVLWARVEDGFHVGSRGGDFLGYVDRQPDGSHRAFDARSVALGDYASLGEATHAVVVSATPPASLAGSADAVDGGLV